MNRLVLFLVAAFLAPVASAQNITWKPVTPGNMQWSNAPQPVTVYRQIGPTTFGTDGSTSHRFGDSSVNSDGSTGRYIGNSYYEAAPDGTKKTCQKIGENVFCSWK